MAQKVNPIAVRLKLNRNHESDWFSDYYYTNLLFQDIYLNQFFDSLRRNQGNKLGIKRTSKCIIQHYPKRSLFYLFYIPNGTKTELNFHSNSLKQLNFKSSFKFTKIPFSHSRATPVQMQLKLGSAAMVEKMQLKNCNQLFMQLCSVQLQLQNAFKLAELEKAKPISAEMFDFNMIILLYWAHYKSNCVFHLYENQNRPLFSNCFQHFSVSLYSPLLNHIVQPHFYYIQSLISHHNNTLASIVPIKMSSLFQCASAVSEEICAQLEQKKAFRQICKSIFQELKNKPFIKGLRVSCSGRINGAEIAKTEWKQFGETSLHVFSDKIDFASSRALTVYGILGVKVWISFR